LETGTNDFSYRVEDEINHNDNVSNNTNKSISYDFDKLKLDLTDQWLGQKKEYYLIYELLKFIYLSEKDIVTNTPLINTTETNKLENILIYSNIFSDLIPNKEILLMHCLNNNNSIDQFQNILKNQKKYNQYNQL